MMITKMNRSMAMLKLRYIITISALMAIMLLHNAQPLKAQNVKRTLSKYYEAAREGTPKPSTAFFKKARKAPDVLEYLQRHTNDTNQTNLGTTYRLLARLALHAPDKRLQQKAIYQLLNGMGRGHNNVDYISSQALPGYSPQLFTQQSKNKLEHLIKSGNYYFGDLVKMAGYLQMEHLKPYLDSVVYSPRLTDTESWACQLALARMGDKRVIKYCVMTVRQYPLNSQTVLNVLPDMAYIRQKMAVDYLMEVVQSKKKNCRPANPLHSEPIVCGYRVMEYLAPIVKDFPLKLHASGQIDADDYKQALSTARKWISSNQDNYALITNVY